MQQSDVVLVADQGKGRRPEVQRDRIVDDSDVQRVAVRAGVARGARAARADVGEIEGEHISIDDSPEGFGEVVLGGCRRRDAQEGQACRRDRGDDSS